MNQGLPPTAEAVSRLIQELNKLPGIGPKSAQRLAYYLLRAPEEQARLLADALLSLLNDKNLRLKMGDKGRIKAEKYSWPNISRQVMDYYNSLLNSHA